MVASPARPALVAGCSLAWLLLAALAAPAPGRAQTGAAGALAAPSAAAPPSPEESQIDPPEWEDIPELAVDPPPPVEAGLRLHDAPSLETVGQTPQPIVGRAAFGDGVTFDAGDTFSLQVRARLQFRVALAHPGSGAIDAGAPPGLFSEILIRRARLVFAGHAFVRELQYYIQLGVAPLDMEQDLLIPLRDARLTWQLHRDFGIRVGQMKVPLGQQRVISSSALQFVDRSIVTTELNLDRDIGLYFLSEDLFGLGGILGYEIGVFGGRGRNRFGALDAAMFVGRIQISPFGAFEWRTEPDFSRSMQPRMAIGLGAAYNIDSNRRRGTHEQVFRVARFDYLHLGADVSFKWAGLSVLAEAMFREADAPSGSGEIDGALVTEYSRSAWGWFAQLGYMLPFPVELAARYGEIRPLEGNAPEASFFLQRELGGAVSIYAQEHALKLQLDYFYYFGDAPRAERHQVRLQAQLFF
ncbi:MAG: hypothetical protein KF729_27825 [Sandaracinaceae bacterium]|nr:hypothetical protein [Sandaracinaceae bacterium]